MVGAAIPAPPDEHTLTQPDGTSFNATQWGAEYNHGWETTKGYTIVQDDNGWWRYATVKDGRITPTDRKVGISPPPAVVPKHVRGAAHGSPALASSQNATPTPERVESIPTTGTVAFPVILVNYPDTETTATPREFERLLFGDDPTAASGPGSMQDYFEEASHGQLTVTAGEAGVTGWVTADHPHDYYTDAGDAQELVQEAIQKTDGEIDYSKYDNNGDGFVDGVIIIHQGSGEEETGDPTDIWSHRWAVEPYETDDGVRVSSYSIQPETTVDLGRTTRNSIGVFAHETGHLLGMTDLYDTDYSSRGIGSWGLMGSGSWNYIDGKAGSSPAHPVAFHKWQQGWISPEKKNPTGPMGRLTPYARTGSTFQWFNNPNGVKVSRFSGEGEYFLAENRQRVGFDGGLPGEGVIITHIDETRPNNDFEDHPMVDIEEADGLNDLDVNRYADAGDPFPGETNQQKFNTDTSPNSRFYNITPSGLNITEFSTQGNNVILNPAPDLTTTSETLQLNIPDTSSVETTTQTVTIRNSGTETATLESTKIGGPDADAFVVETATDGVVLTPGETVAVEVSFTPDESTKQNYAATAQFTYEQQDASLEVALNGTVETAKETNTGLSISAESYSITPNKSAVVSYSITNNGSQTITASTIVNGSTLPTSWVIENITGTDPNPADQFAVITEGSEVAFSDIGAGETVTVTAIVTPPSNATSRTYTLAADLHRNRSTVGTATASITVTEGNIIARYDTDGDGVETAELLTAIQDWRQQQLETQKLLTLIDAWRSR
jgi:M6 family metalloprotease-like protein